MIFLPNKFYRHDSTLDIDIHVLGHYPSADMLYVAYFNRQYKIYQGEREYVRIPKDKTLWREVKHEN